MPKGLSWLMPFFGASLLLILGYLLLNPAPQLLAAPQGVVLQVDRLDDPALPAGSACTGAANDCTLRGAVDAAASGDTIEVAVAGTIVLAQGSIALTKDLTITSASEATHLVDGNESSVIFVIGSGRTVQLNGLTLQNGLNSSESGGAVVMTAGTLTMTNMILQDNVASDKGGALSIIANGVTANVALSTVTFLNNYAIDDLESGGAIHASASNFSSLNLSIEDGHFENNIGGTYNEISKSGYGGAISASTLDAGSRLSLEIRSSEFISNGSGYGGALYLFSNNHDGSNSAEVETLIVDSRFVDNHSEYGGAIYSGALEHGSSSTLDIRNSTFADNTSDADGGALHISSSNSSDPALTSHTAAIRNSTFNDNLANGNGGALYLSSSGSGATDSSLASLDLVNVTISNNRAVEGSGGALYSASWGFASARALVTATHVTAFNNSYAGDGNFALLVVGQSSLYLKNSILSGSGGISCDFSASPDTAIEVLGVNNLIFDTSCGSGAPFRLGNPLGVIHTLANNGGATETHALYAGSNALNAVPAGQCTIGNSATVLTTDQRGETRPFGASCDVGAFEAQSATLPAAAAITGVTASNDGPRDRSEAIVFTATSTGGDVDFYEWDFGDGTTGVGITTTHAYTASGIYTASVIATNVVGTRSATTEVKVGSRLVGLTVSNTSPNIPERNISFEVNLEEGEEYTITLDYGDGQRGTLNWPYVFISHPYAAVGVYTVTVVASNIVNTLTATTTVYIVDQAIRVRDDYYDPSEISILPGSTVGWRLLEGTHSVTAVDGSFNQPAGSDWPPFMVTFPTPGTYEYYCTVHGKDAMSGKIIVRVPVDLRLPNIIRPPEVTVLIQD